MRDFIINNHLLEYKMHVLTIDRTMDCLSEVVSPTSYLCDKLIKLGASHKKEHREYYKFHCTPENLNLVFEVFKQKSFLEVLEKHILEDTKTKIDIEKVYLDFEIDTHDGFFSYFHLQIGLIKIPLLIDEKKVKNKILEKHKDLNIVPRNFKFKVLLCSEDRVSISHTLYYDKAISPEQLIYLKDIKKSIYKIKYQPNSVFLDGYTTMNLEDIIDG